MKEALRGDLSIRVCAAIFTFFLHFLQIKCQISIINNLAINKYQNYFYTVKIKGYLDLKSLNAGVLLLLSIVFAEKVLKK